jgi:hypothetical protein
MRLINKPWTDADDERLKAVPPPLEELGFGRPAGVSMSCCSSCFASLFKSFCNRPSRSLSALRASKDGREPPDASQTSSSSCTKCAVLASGWLMRALQRSIAPAIGLLGERPYESVLRTCWDSYVGAAVRAAAPDLIVVIGRQVGDAIGHTVRRDLGADVRIDAVKQPNAHMSATERAQYRRRVFDLCRAR